MVNQEETGMIYSTVIISIVNRPQDTIQLSTIDSFRSVLLT